MQPEQFAVFLISSLALSLLAGIVGERCFGS